MAFNLCLPYRLQQQYTGLANRAELTSMLQLINSSCCTDTVVYLDSGLFANVVAMYGHLQKAGILKNTLNT